MAVVDTKVYLRCPHSYDDSNVTYAYMDCILNEDYPENSNDSAKWGHSDIMLCPPPPVALLLQQVYSEFMVSVRWTADVYWVVRAIQLVAAC